MKKINTKTKLRITNNKTKLITEATPTGAYEQFKDATGAKEAVGIIKNLAKTSLAITKFFGLNVLPIKALGQQLKNTVWHGKKFDWEAFKADYKEFSKKGYDQFNKDIDDLVKDHENNFRNMLSSGMGMTEGEADALMFAGSPPIAIMNKLYDLAKEKRGSGIDRDNFLSIERLSDLVPTIIYLYITGRDPATDDEPGKLMSSITADYNKYIKTYGSDAKIILDNLHREKYYKRHFTPLKNKCKNIYKAFDFNLKIVRSIDLASKDINDGTIEQFIKDFKSYCNDNNVRLESFSRKSLNLKTMLIKEADADDDPTKKEDMDFDQMEVHNFGVIIAFIYIRMNQDKIKDLLVKSMSDGEIDLKKFNDVLNNKNTIMTNMAIFFLFYLNKKILMQLADKFIADTDYDFKSKGKIFYEQEYEKSINKFDASYKLFFEKAVNKNKDAPIYQVLNKNDATSKDIGDAIASFLAAKNFTDRDAKLANNFQWDKLKSERVVERLFKTKLTSNKDIPFLKAVQESLNTYKEEFAESKNTGLRLQKKLEEKFKPDDSKDSTGL